MITLITPLIVLLAQSVSNPPGVPSGLTPVVEYHGTFTHTGNSTSLLGVPWVIPDRPGPDNDWQEFHVHYELTYDTTSWVHNQSNSVVPRSTGIQNYSSTLFKFRNVDGPYAGKETMPWFMVGMGNFNWPELDPGERYRAHNYPWGTYYWSQGWYQYSWHYPYYYNGFLWWSGPEPGTSVQLEALAWPWFTTWPGFQNNPTGEYPYGTEFTFDLKIWFWWDQQLQ